MTKINTAFKADLITLAVEVIVNNSFGSGIYITKDDQIFFCTARHVIYKNTNPRGVPSYQFKQDKIELKSYPKNGNFENFEKLQVSLNTLNASKMVSFNQDVDLCVFKIADMRDKRIFLVPGIVKVGASLNLNVADSSMVKDSKDIEVGEELYVIGYPKALQFLNRKQPFYDYNLPLVRKGITSCMNNYKTFVIDCAVFGGNSGGPVFIAENTIVSEGGVIKVKNRRHLIGIAVQYIPLLNQSANKVNPKGTSTFRHAENSGYAVCVSFSEITKEIDKLIADPEKPA